jgi:beta-galactosidase
MLSNASETAPLLKSRPDVGDLTAPLRLSLNRGWRFRRSGDGGDYADLVERDGEFEPAEHEPWQSVNLPHSVRLEPLNASGGRNYQGICWYCRGLELRPQWRGRKLMLHFEGAMQVADVWLSGRKLHTHHGGYTPFTIDLTPFADFEGGKNLLVVRLDNRDDPQVPPGKPQAQLDFTYFGGLYRNVWLDVRDRLHVSDPLLADTVAGGGVFVTYPHVSSDGATVHVRTDVRNDHEVDKDCVVLQELAEVHGELVASGSSRQVIQGGSDATFSHTLELTSPKLWHPHRPHLYTLRTVVLDGGHVADIQTTRIGIRHIRFDADAGLFINGERFLSIGANRHQDHPYVGYALPDGAHWRDAKKLRDAGFTSVRSHYPQAPAFMDACDELGMLAIVSNPGWQFVGDRLFQERAVRNARVMVRRDRNRPSVILWEAALNESANAPLCEALRRAVHEEYPTDPCYTAGDREDGCTWDVEYLHNNGSKPYWIREWGDRVDNWTDQQSRNRVARGWGEVPMLHQASAHAAQMDEIMLGHHGSSSGAGASRLCGACLWAGIDHQRGYHHQPFFGGVLDAMRLPKFSYYFFQSQRRVDDGPMVFIANFATFLSPTAVTVFSNCEQVRLRLGGEEVAVQRPDAGHRVPHPPFTFTVSRFATERSTMFMSPGIDAQVKPLELLAEGLIGGKVVATHVMRPPGVARQLLLRADLCGRDLLADGSDWIRVHALVCDAHGTVCPFADDAVHFTVDGEGEVVGGLEIGANPVRAEAGIATALVRGTTHSARVIVRARSFGLADGVVEVRSRPPVAS